MIRVQRRPLLRIVVLVAITLAVTLIIVTLEPSVGYRLWRGKVYLGAGDVSANPDAFIGQQIRLQGALANSGIGQTVEACNPPVYTFTSFVLVARPPIHLMECEIEQCTMICPLFAPHIDGSYEIVGTLAYCASDSRSLCLINIVEIYRLENVTLDGRVGQKIPITPGPTSFIVGQQWEP